MAGRTYVDTPVRSSRTQGGWVMVVAAITAMRKTLRIWHERTCYRRTLARMSERELADIGVNWSEIANEAGKPFWRE